MNVSCLIAETANAVPMPPWALPAAGIAVAALMLLLMSLSLLRQRSTAQEVPQRSVLNLPREDTKRNGQGEERRQYRRRGGNPTTVHVSAAKGQAEPWEGLVVDRSQGGLCLLLDRELEEGTHISVRPAHAPEYVPWVEATAVYSRPVGQRWHIGCRFVEHPPLNVLLFFG